MEILVELYLLFFCCCCSGSRLGSRTKTWLCFVICCATQVESPREQQIYQLSQESNSFTKSFEYIYQLQKQQQQTRKPNDNNKANANSNDKKQQSFAKPFSNHFFVFLPLFPLVRGESTLCSQSTLTTYCSKCVISFGYADRPLIRLAFIAHRH